MGDSPFSNVLQISTQDMDVSSVDSLKQSLGLPAIEGTLTNRVRESHVQSLALVKKCDDSIKELENLVDEASQKKSTYFDAYSEMSTDISLKKKSGTLASQKKSTYF